MKKEELLSIINDKYKVLKDNNQEIDVKINNHLLRYIKQSHKYIVDGYNTLSVNELIKRTNPNLYEGVDKSILKKGSRRGDIMHEQIDYYEKTGNISFSDEFKNYLKLKDENEMTGVTTELFVLICNTNNEPLCAGRLDLLYLDKLGDISICDFKRTYELYYDNVTLQLNLYSYAFTQTFGLEVKNLICMRLRDQLHEIVDIKLDKDIAVSSILAYL